MNLSDRIKSARKHAQLTQRQLADRVGIAQAAISQLESGRALRTTYITDIASACGVSSTWLATGDGEMTGGREASGRVAADAFKAETHDAADKQLHPVSVWDDNTPLGDDEVEVPFLKEVELSAGSGRTVIEQSSTAKLRFGKRSLRANNVQFENAVCVVVGGNSMEPVLPHGSTVGVNTGETSVIDGKIYALKHDGQLRVKVLYRAPGGGIRLRSFNQAEHPDETYTSQDMEDLGIEIIGRVFWGASFF
jgi:phage repressor protein C with HTH and peptisase S24 domain